LGVAAGEISPNDAVAERAVAPGYPAAHIGGVVDNAVVPDGAVAKNQAAVPAAVVPLGTYATALRRKVIDIAAKIVRTSGDSRWASIHSCGPTTTCGKIKIAQFRL